MVKTKDIPKMQYRISAKGERGAYVQVETHFMGEAVRVANAFWALLLGTRGQNADKRFSLQDMDDERTEIRHENNKRTFWVEIKKLGGESWQRK